MSDTVLIPLAGIGTLELPRDVYEQHLRPLQAPAVAPTSAALTELVTAKALAVQLSLPLSCIYEYARTNKIPATRVGRHVRFSPVAVLAALSVTGAVPGGRG